MGYLVFDIESAPLPFDSFDEGRQEYLLRGCESEEEREERKGQMALNGLTGQVVCIGLVYAETLESEPKGFVYSNVPGASAAEQTLPDGSLWRQMSEPELFAKWWEVIDRRDIELISFNGRGFDGPFLMHRSAALGVRPSINLMSGTRFRYDRHTDLADELAFYATSYGRGISPLKRFNLDFYCKAFGITSPKEEGVTGDQVPRLFAAAEHRTIAEYCVRDVFSTWELYRYWRRYLSF